MLPVANRLTRRSDFELLRREGKTVYTKLLRVRYRPTRRPSSRVAVVVSLQVSKKATKRNRVKRRTAEVVRKTYPALPVGFDIAFYPSAAVADVEAAVLAGAIIEVLKKARLLT